MNHLSARELAARRDWRPTGDPDTCTHPGRSFYLEAGPNHVVRRCRSCGAQLHAVVPRCVVTLPIGRRCMAPVGGMPGLCRSHVAGARAVVTQSSRRVLWIAGPNGIAHAHRPGQPRNLCGSPVLAEHFAWPERDRCATCVRAVVMQPPPDGNAA